MKIAVCASMVFSPELLELEKQLTTMGHKVVLPDFTAEYARMQSRGQMKTESAHNKISNDLIKGYFHKIKDSDAILVFNLKKGEVDNYIGGNTFLEMGFAHVLEKPIFLYNPIPNMHYLDELEAMKPIIINKDLSKIRNIKHQA